jgi:putative ABC transport system permease protein
VIVNDAKYALRKLTRTPGFTLVAILLLAIGIGANTAMFSLIRGVLLRPLPYVQPERLVTLWESVDHGALRWEVSYPNFVDFKARARSFDSLSAYTMLTVTVTGNSEPERLTFALVTPDVFQTLGIQPALGRTFTADEDRPGGAPAVMISDSLWRARFGASPSVIGQTLRVNGSAATVIGVMPRGFQFPSEETSGWLALGIAAGQFTTRSAHILYPVARLKERVDLGQALTEMNNIARTIDRENPGADPDHGIEIVPLHDLLVANARPALLVLFGAVAALLLIVTANIANLLIARAANRRRTTAIQIALGASRGRLVREAVVECLCVGIAGSAAGIVIGVITKDVLIHGVGHLIPLRDQVQIDTGVFAFAIAASLLTSLLFGVVPALITARGNIQLATGGSSGNTETPHGKRTRATLIAIEAALSMALLTGAGLLLKSLWLLDQVQPGFRTDHLLTATVSLPPGKYRATPAATEFFMETSKRIAAIPGVQAASAVNRLPMSGGDANGDITIEGRPASKGAAPGASFRRVLPDYFNVMEIPIVEGRRFTASDNGQGGFVVIINRKMAREFWPDGTAIGKRIKIGPAETEPWLTVVGVAGDVHNIGLDSDPVFATYEPYAQRPALTLTYVVRTSQDANSVAATIRSTIRSAESEVTISNMTTMEDRIAASISPRRLNLMLLGTFAAFALGLAIVGIYGSLSYAVSQRMREIGIRMALGAESAHIVGLVLREGIVPTLWGTGAGIIFSVGSAPWIERLLYGTGGLDAATYSIVGLVLIATSALASYLPARRARNADAISILKTL